MEAALQPTTSAYTPFLKPQAPVQVAGPALSWVAVSQAPWSGIPPASWPSIPASVGYEWASTQPVCGWSWVVDGAGGRQR